MFLGINIECFGNKSSFVQKMDEGNLYGFRKLLLFPEMGFYKVNSRCVGILDWFLLRRFVCIISLFTRSMLFLTIETTGDFADSPYVAYNEVKIF